MAAAERWSYDVFLSFRGETRKRFTDHLYFALKEEEIFVYKDDNELRRGEDISSGLLRAIDNSRMSIIVFSGDYASSRWCLEELQRIMMCRKLYRQQVIPIFYGIDPSDVGNQAGSFAQAFRKHEERYDHEKVAKWRSALTEAANLSGWDLNNAANGHEAKFIKKIVRKVSMELKQIYFDIAIYPVGLDAHVRHVNYLLNIGSSGVRMIGISGMGGLGKTTIAKAIYNELFYCFNNRSFLGSVRRMWLQPNGMVTLQKQLLSDILKSKIDISNVDYGTNVITERLFNKRVLIVVDDVDDIEQLNALAIRCDLFGSRSRIIITSRDESLMDQLEVYRNYKVEELKNNESLKLFSLHAFKESHPPKKFAQLSKDVVAFCKGLPLAIEVLGSYLFSKDIVEWRSVLKNLRGIHPDKIQQKLRISFEALDYTEKSIFLDIACFFVGFKRDIIISILEDCGFFAASGIDVLHSRCLIKFSSDENILKHKIVMHDLLQEMAKEIIEEESLIYLGRRSRLWVYEDVIDVLTKDKGTEAIEGLMLDLSTNNEMNFQAKSFTQMNKLRLLKLNYVQMTGNFACISSKLRWLSWNGFPLKSLPLDFYQENLVAIELQYSKLNQVWIGRKVLKKLKFLDLSYSENLIRSPEFWMLPNLEVLNLKGCTSLDDLHESIRDLDKLVILNLKNCMCLKTLPSSIVKLNSLEKLNLSGCLKINKLPEDIGKLKSLRRLILNKAVIGRLPLSIICLEKLEYLSLDGCNLSSSSSRTLFSSRLWSWTSPRRETNSTQLLPISMNGLSSLSTLCLNNCNLTEDLLPNDLWNLPSLELLNLQGNKFKSLPVKICSLPNIKCLQLDNCSQLQSLPALPITLEALYATECHSLEQFPDISNFSAPLCLYLNNCKKLVEIPGLSAMESTGVFLHGCNSLSVNFITKILQEWDAIVHSDVFFPGKEIPEMFDDFQAEGSSLSFQLPRDKQSPFRGFTLCVLYSSNSIENIITNNDIECFPRIKVINKTADQEWEFRPSCYSIPIPHEDHLWINGLPFNYFWKQFDRGDHVEIIIEMGEELIVKR